MNGGTATGVKVMLTVERRKFILEKLYRDGSVKVNELAALYGVGGETIRRDLKALASDWDISVVYGGAYLKNKVTVNSVQEDSIVHKRNENFEAKQIIAKKAAELVNPGDIIAINSGSTVEYILDYLGGKTPLSIVTLNVNQAAKASLIPGVEVYLPGGKVRSTSGMTIGPDAGDFIRSFTINKCFFGISAVSLSRGITHPVMEEVPNNRALLSVSDKVYVVADSSKCDKHSLFSMAKLEEVDAFIVDNHFPESYRKYMALNGIEVL
jgi:DeoR/GlpR family transcriptional regulator of sugar metabolism